MIGHSLLPLLLALWTGVAPAGHPPDGEVSEVRIASEAGETEIMIRTRGDVRVRDFLLSDPARLIVDVEGARHALPGHAFEGIGRGGVIRLRSSQFREDVVRLVFDLSGRVDYSVEDDGGGIRIRFSNPGGSFAAWSTVSRGDVGTTAGGSGASYASPAADRGAEPRRGGRPAEARSPAQGGPPAVIQDSEQPRISVRYDSANMLDVIAGFAEFSGRSIVPGEGVSGKMVRGVDINDQPWDVALDAILESRGLGWRRTESGIILVDELQNIRSRDTLQTETRVFRINYAGADTVAQALQELASPKGQVVAYQGTNSVIVTDAPSVVSRMDSLINILDQRTPQVAIEAKIVLVDRNQVSELGLQYELHEREGGISENSPSDLVQGIDAEGEPTNDRIINFAGPSIGAVANANAPVTSPALEILTSTVFGEFSLFTFLQALERHELSDIQAAPTIQVVDNHVARIQVGERTPIRVLEPSAQLQQAQVNVQFEDTGIILEVTPHVTNNNQILLDLMAERSAIQELAAADLGFTFQKTIGESRLLLNDGETGVIGGLTLSELTRTESGIPGLMNIPLVGALFRTTSRTERKQDLIILVTPHIVNPGVGADAAGVGAMGSG